MFQHFTCYSVTESCLLMPQNLTYLYVLLLPSSMVMLFVK